MVNIPPSLDSKLPLTAGNPKQYLPAANPKSVFIIPAVASISKQLKPMASCGYDQILTKIAQNVSEHIAVLVCDK